MRRPPGLKSEKAKRLFDQLVAELEADTVADREQVALAVRYRLKSDDLLANDRLTAANETGRRADAILGQLRRRPTAPPSDTDSPRLKWLRAALPIGGHRSMADRDAAVAADEDAALYDALLLRSHQKEWTAAEKRWAAGETVERPSMPDAA